MSDDALDDPFERLKSRLREAIRVRERGIVGPLRRTDPKDDPTLEPYDTVIELLDEIYAECLQDRGAHEPCDLDEKKADLFDAIECAVRVPLSLHGLYNKLLGPLQDCGFQERDAMGLANHFVASLISAQAEQQMRMRGQS